MRHTILLLLIVLLLSACGGSPDRSPTTEPASAVTPTTTTTATPAPSPTATATPAPSPTATATPAPSPTATMEAPAEAPATPAPAAIGQPALLDGPFDVAAQAAALLPDQRGVLDRAAEWDRYTIAASIDPQARSLSGQQRIEYTNRGTAPLDRIYLRLFPNLSDFGGSLDVSTLAVDTQPVEVVYESGGYLLRIDLPQPLLPGNTTTITLAFTTIAPANASGVHYGAFNRENGVLALASSYPILALVRDGVWEIDLPDGRGDFVNSETALYDVTLIAPADWKLATTGTVIDGRLEAGMQMARIVSGPQRDFAIAALQLEALSADVDGTRVTSYYRAGREAGGRVALDAAVNALRAFNERFGRYPLVELDVIEIAASTFLGVEYPGLIMMEQRLYDQPGTLEIVVAHEVAHQWWYSLVGNDVQREAWLDEALASYAQIVYQEYVYGPEAAERELEGFRQRYRNAIAAGLDAPVARPNSAFQANYVALVYGKAVLFLEAIREQIGDETFYTFLQEYYATYRYDIATGPDLVETAEESCGCELDQLYNDWIVTLAPVEIP